MVKPHATHVRVFFSKQFKHAKAERRCEVDCVISVADRLTPWVEILSYFESIGPDRPQVRIYTAKLDSDMYSYRTCHEPMLASMGMQTAILYNTCGI